MAKLSGAEMLYQQRIKYLSYSRHMTLSRLAETAGMSMGELRRVLDSERPDISLEQAAAVAEALDVTVNYLILGE